MPFLDVFRRQHGDDLGLADRRLQHHPVDLPLAQERIDLHERLRGLLIRDHHALAKRRNLLDVRRGGASGQRQQR
ncbi:hypothetical protein [Lysobacter capsici]|uniref:hypothetical protein n=1 Tax=Lysobacter capsici TaxID=435897 RepID=UPI00398D18C3